MDTEVLKKGAMILESHVLECDRIIDKLTKVREDVIRDIDNYLTVIQKQRSRFSGDATALTRSYSVLTDEKRKNEWRERVLLRDDFTCRKCKSRDKLTVHHLIPKSVCAENLIWNETNGIVLCQKCHNDWHEKYGNELSTMKFVRWLKEDLYNDRVIHYKEGSI